MTDELPELLRSVIARPDDHDVLRVYADALIEQGDTRGELIVVQLLRREADSPELAARERELVARLDGELAAQLGLPATAFAWRRGFLEAIDFSPAGEQRALADAVRTLGTLPAARQLRRIVIRFVEPGWGSMGPIISALTKVAPQLRALRELVFTTSPRDDDGVPQMPVHFGDIAPLCRAIPRLEVLEIGGCDYPTLRELQAPSLKRLVIENPAGYELERIARLRAPELAELELHGGAWDARSLGWLLACDLPLRHLWLASENPDVLAHAARVVPPAPVFRRVRSFALTGAALERAGIDALISHAIRLRQLDTLVVEPAGAASRLVEALGDIVAIR